MTGGLLAVHAHPDDETLSNGALLATWARAGGPTTVVTCTRGERGEVIPAELAHLEGDGPALARHREGELALALRALGVDDHAFLDRLPLPGGPGAGAGGPRWEDSGMAWLAPGTAGAAADVPGAGFVRADVDDAAARLAGLLVDRRPDVVVGYEPHGGYGHPDHVHSHRVMTRAVELAAAAPRSWQVPVVLWTVLREDVLRRAWRATRAPVGFTAPDPDGPAPSAAVTGPVDLEVDVAPVVGRVLAALAAHATQVHLLTDDPGQPQAPRAQGTGDALAHYALSNRVVQPLLRHETYRVAAELAGGRVAVAWPAGVRPTWPAPARG